MVLKSNNNQQANCWGKIAVEDDKWCESYNHWTTTKTTSMTTVIKWNGLAKWEEFIKMEGLGDETNRGAQTRSLRMTLSVSQCHTEIFRDCLHGHILGWTLTTMDGRVAPVGGWR